MLNQIVEISKAIGNLEFQVERNLKLRKENRIKSIHSSLAIENNSLIVEQITITDGKRVSGDSREIKEVKNAYDSYLIRRFSLEKVKKQIYFSHKN